jgi:hypothetical protein
MSSAGALLLLLVSLPAAAEPALSRESRPMLCPTLSAGWGLALGPGTDRFPITAGVAFYPELGSSFLAPRLGVALDLGIEPAEADRSTHLSFTPVVQAGLAFLLPGRHDKRRFTRALLPLLHLYTLFGVRWPGSRDGTELPTAIRVGIGLSSPVLSLVAVALAKIVVPNLVELSAEIEPSTRHTSWHLKLGVGI